MDYHWNGYDRFQSQPRSSSPSHLHIFWLENSGGTVSISAEIQLPEPLFYRWFCMGKLIIVSISAEIQLPEPPHGGHGRLAAEKRFQSQPRSSSPSHNQQYVSQFRYPKCFNLSRDPAPRATQETVSIPATLGKVSISAEIQLPEPLIWIMYRCLARRMFQSQPRSSSPSHPPWSDKDKAMSGRFNLSRDPAPRATDQIQGMGRSALLCFNLSRDPAPRATQKGDT